MVSVTDEQTIDAVDSVLNEQVNREVAQFVSSHDCDVARFGKEVLLCENLGNMTRAMLARNKVLTDPIMEALENGKMPILSSTASDQMAFVTMLMLTTSQKLP